MATTTRTRPPSFGELLAATLPYLALGRRFGVAPQKSPDIPWDRLTQRFGRTAGFPAIVKPVNGGVYTRVLADASADDAWLRQFSSEPTISGEERDLRASVREPRTSMVLYQHAALALRQPVAPVRKDVVPNRYGTRHIIKPLVLYLAKSVGIAFPQTIVTNERERLKASQAERPRRPDLCIYRVGNQWFAFALESEAIDYRVDQKLRIRQVRVMAELVIPLAQLMDHLGLESGAYKGCPETGKHLFLEVNSATMFIAFDRVVSGALSDRMIDWLLARPGPAERPTGCST